MRGAIPKGDKVLRLRRAAGLTQEALAAESDSDVKTIRNAEHSKRVDVATLRRIAARLGVEYREVLTEDSPTQRDARVAAAERWIAAFNARDKDAIVQCFDEQGKVIVLADPALPGTGEYRGCEQIRHWAEVCFATFLTEPITPSMYEVDAVGDYVFVRVDRPRLKCLLNGNESRVSVMWEFTVRNSQILQFRAYPESGTIERMVLSSQFP